MIMNESHSTVKSQCPSAIRNGKRIFGVSDGTTQDRVDVDTELCVIGKPLKFPIQYFQALVGNFIGVDIIDADLQIIEASSIQTPDVFDAEEIPIRQQTGEHVVVTDAPY